MRLDGLTKGMAAGAVGVAAMTATEKVEQRFTGRPDSYVPARTLAHLLRLQDPDDDRLVRNHVMHWGTGILVGGLRGVMAARGLRGARASTLHTVARLSTDQTLENATGVGSPPWTWPREELIIDVGHKAVYSLVTGWVADLLVKPAVASTTPPTAPTPVETPAGTADVPAPSPVAADEMGATGSIDVPDDATANPSPS